MDPSLKEEYHRKKTIAQRKGHLFHQKIVTRYTSSAVKKGKLQKKYYCEHCNITDVAIQGHHPSYLRPLEVTWLCISCHGKEHKRLNELKRNAA